MRRAFEGMRVVDASQGVAGPHCTMLLALHGADVIKIEPPDGDWGRALGLQKGGHTVHFISFNRGKRSMVVDLANPASRPLMKTLVSGANVVAESFRPGVAKKLGLGVDDVQAITPNIVYLSVSGYGQHGPNRERPTVDGLIQAHSGMMVMNGSADAPHRQRMIAIDIVTGLYAFQAVSAALMRQVRFNEGASLDVSLMQSAAAFQAVKIMEAQAEGLSPPPPYSPSGMFETSDGKIVISAMRQRNFEILCDVLGCGELASDPKLATQELRNENRQGMNRVLQQKLRTKTSKEWLGLLIARNVMASPINSYIDWMSDEHVRQVQAFADIDFDGFGSQPVAEIPGCPSPREIEALGHVPKVGEQTRDILSDLGLSKPHANELLAKGVVA